MPTTITNLEHQAIYGSMLGDGATHYYPGRTNCNEYLVILHSIQQKGLLYYESQYITRWEPVFAEGTTKLNKKTFRNIYMRTSACPLFTTEGHKWYIHNKDYKYKLRWNGRAWQRNKHLPWDLFDVLGSEENEGLALAIWYMDDGSLERKPCGSLRIKLSSQSFSELENHMLAQFLIDRWGIDARVYPNNNRHILSLTVESTKKFLKIVEPWVQEVPCMDYKLGK